MFMIYDTETTGIPVSGQPSGGENQPHIVQVSAALMVDDGTLLPAYNAIVRPDGWAWDDANDEAAQVHEVTFERAMAEGLPEQLVLAAILGLAEKATSVVAHNAPFDHRIVRIAQKRYGYDEDQCEAWKAKPRCCTMQMTRSYQKQHGLSGKVTLEDASRVVLGRTLAPAPGEKAERDMLACADLFRHFRGMNAEAAAG